MRALPVVSLRTKRLLSQQTNQNPKYLVSRKVSLWYLHGRTDVCGATTTTMLSFCSAGSFATCVPPVGSEGSELLTTGCHGIPVPQTPCPGVLAFNCFAILSLFSAQIPFILDP